MKNQWMYFAWIFIGTMNSITGQEANPMEPASTIGSLTLRDGSVYFGQTEAGQMSGIGTQYFKDGKHRTGYFQDNTYLADFIATPPWHMVGLYFTLDQSYEMETFSVDLKVLSDVPDDLYLYISPFGGGRINETGFYGGIQTQCGGYQSVLGEQNDGPFIPLGRAMIFSRWGNRESSAIRMAAGGVCESSGYEGDFISVRNSLKWKKGTYTLTLKKTEQTVLLSTELHTRVELQVYDHQKKQTFVCGSLAFPGTTLVLDPENYLFFELYSKRVNVNELPPMKFVCENYCVNGKPVHIPFVAANYDKNFPKYADAAYANGTFSVEIGKPSNKPVTEGETINFNILYSDE